MWKWWKRSAAHGFLDRLRSDARGNTLAIVAAAMIPLAGMIGGGIDMSRMYLTKTRLQHACDAGALAGRRAMGGGTWAQSGGRPNTIATQFFNANFLTGSYGTSNTPPTFSEVGGKVTGTVTATVPMTLMRVLNQPTQTITVSCDAEMRLPNTDVMFVLDTTGSMNCTAGDPTCTNNGGLPTTNSKIGGLKTAVKCFYEIVARLNTDATCATQNGTDGTGGQVQVRFGFVPYASSVNVGHLLPTSYFANTWTYQSRIFNSFTWGSWTTYSTGSTDRNGNCNAAAANTTTRQYQVNKSNSTCTYQYRDRSTNWDYRPVSFDISGLKNGSSWNPSIQVPINDIDASNRTIAWDGCVEERPTVRTTNFSPIPAGAYDLNIDLVPTQGNSNSLLGPSLPDLIYYRQITTAYTQANTANVTSTSNFYQGADDFCPTESRLLQTWGDANTFDTYVNSLTAQGNTYHDIGLLWGARLMSPTGMFAATNAYTPQGGEIQRHMIFMTDGDSTSSPCDYNAYGVPFYDQRETTDVGTAGNCATNRQALIDQINLRTAALCTAIKNMNITLWVISYGGGTNAATEARLQTCASDGKYFSASDPAALQTTFASIASQISQLRLTR